MSVVLQFQSVSKRFGSQTVLTDIDLSVNAGEFLTFLGPSGSGKTTLLRLAGGFEQADEGRIFLNGEDISDLPPYRRHVNTVFQSYALFPHLNVFNNVAFGLRNLGILQAEVQGRVRSALQLVQLAGLDDRFPHELSGGQQQRVALARALVMRPSVLLLDEPFGALDQQLRKQMQVELKDLQRKLGLTFVFVTHDQEEALSLSDRVVLLHQGLLQQVGSPEEIYQHPKTRFAAEFMGVENIVEVKAFRPDGSTVRCRLASGDEVVIRKADESPPGQCFLAVRSSEVSISRSFPAPGERNVVRGRIRHQNYLGGAILWTVEAAPNEDWMASQLVSRDSGPIEKFSIGEEVFLSWDSRSGLLVS